MLTDTLLVNGTDLQSITGLTVEDLSGLRAPGRRRGDNFDVPGRRGQVAFSKPLAAYAFDVPVALAADTRAAALTILDQVAILARENLVSLTRRLTTSSSTVLQDASGEYVDGLAAQMLNAQAGRTVLQFLNLDGCWFDQATTSIAPGTVTVGGTTDTRRMTITLPGAGTLTNSTLGVSVTVTTACTLDVEAFTASAGLATLTQSGDDYWFRLRPGSNTITWSGTGTPSIAYKAAWL